MTLNGLFRGIGDFMQWTFNLLQADAIGDIFNYGCIVLGFVGLFYWLNVQKKLSAKAEAEGTLK